jgi:hypothetical protein
MLERILHYLELARRVLRCLDETGGRYAAYRRTPRPRLTLLEAVRRMEDALSSSVRRPGQQHD